MTAIPEIDAAIGIGVYATSFPGLGGGYQIRASPEDFEVDEILSMRALKSIRATSDNSEPRDNYNATCGDDHNTTDFDTAGGNNNGGGVDDDNDNGYAVYLLTKRGIDTAHALSAIYKMTGARLKPLGLKDAAATTRQYVCSVGAKGRRLRPVTHAKFGLQFEGFAKRPLTKKQMLGNRFRIRIVGDWDIAAGSNNDDKNTHCNSNANNGAFGAVANPADFDVTEPVPNFYGYQRFGSRRPVTHLVGRAIIQRDFEEAVRLILEFDSAYDLPQRRELRSNLADPESYQRSAKKLPPGMDTERLVLEALAGGSSAFDAFKAIPLQLRRLYVSAYQSYLFNRALSDAIADGENLSDPVRGDVCFDAGGSLAKYDPSLHQNRTLNLQGTNRSTTGKGNPYGTRKNTRYGRGALGEPADSIRTRAASVAFPIVGYSYYAKTRFDPYVSHVLDEESVLPKDFFIKEMQEISGEGGFRDAILQCVGYSWDSASKTVQFSLIRGSFATMLLREIIKPPDPVMAGF